MNDHLSLNSARRAIISSLLFSASLLSALMYNGGTLDLLLISAFLLMLFSFLIKNTIKASPVIFLLLTLLFINYSISIHAEWSLVIMTGFIMGGVAYTRFSTDIIQEQWPLYSWVIILTIALTSIFGVWEYISSLKRVDGQMLDANVYAITQYMAFFLLMGLPGSMQRMQQCFRWGVTFLVLTALFATYSRGATAAWLGAFCGVIILSVIKPLFGKHYLLRLIGLSLIAFGIVKLLPIFFGDGWVNRGIEDIAHLNHRTYIWGASWDVVEKMPWLGYGLGAFINIYAGERYEFITSGTFAHNDYLQLLIEGGPVFLLLILSYMLFYCWLGLRILFEKNEIVERKQNHYKGLLSCIAIGMALSVHAVLNYVFYVLSIQLLTGMILARTIYLARTLGYLKQPRWQYERMGGVTSVCLMFLIFSLSMMAVPRKAFYDVGNMPISKSWVNSVDLAQKVLLIDGDNQISAVFLFNSLLNGLDNLPVEQQQQSFELAYDFISQLKRQYPYMDDYYWQEGVLLDRAISLGLDVTIANGQVSKVLYERALELNPGNMLANTSMLDLMIADGRVEEAKELLRVARQWEPLLRPKDRKLLAEMVEKLDGHS